MSGKQEDYHGIDAYFTATEFAEFSDYEKLRMRNMKQNYEMMLEVGLDVPPPDFMRKPAGATRRRRKPKYKEDYSDEEEDESWVPGGGRKSRARNRTPATFKVPLKRKKVEKKEVPHTVSTPPVDDTCDSFEALAHIDISDLKFEGVDTSEAANNLKPPESPKERRHRLTTAPKKKPTEELRRYPARKGARKCYRDIEAPEDDVFVYCEDCHELYKDNCKTHPLTHIEDTTVTSKCKNHAKLSLPPGLVVKEAGIQGAGEGVWAEQFFPKGVRFGPYGGEIVDEEVGRESGYAWEIFGQKKKTYFINGQNERKANWMRYVNCARNELEQNLVAYQYRSEIYYRSFKPIQPGTELLVFYGEEYAKELGIEEDQFVNDGLRHECQVCGRLFNGKLYYLKHLKYRHHQFIDLTLYVSAPSPARTNKSLCKMVSANGKSSLITQSSCMVTTQNNTVMPSETTHSNEVMQSDSVKNNEGAGDNTFTCPLCRKGFKHRGDLNAHAKMMHTDETPCMCAVCGKGFIGSGDLNRHRKVHTGEKPYQCRHCDKAFTTMQTLRGHERIHTGEKPYQCRHCDKAFTIMQTLRRHEMIHTGEKPYQCSHCDKAFVENGNLRIHERIHTGEKPHQCRHCDKAFAQANDLKRHERIHIGEKPYQCRHCGKAFNRIHNLKVHERIHTGEKPYQCGHCDNAFSDRNAFRRHGRIHTDEKPYQCRHCDKAFTLMHNLRTHERIHTGEKPYQCRHCDKAFTTMQTLRRHERIHTDEKPYQCRHCDKAFSNGNYFSRHKATHIT